MAGSLAGQEALRYAAIGWRVVPLWPRKKNPRLQAWQEAATTDEETIASWFEQWPDSGVGVVLGRGSGIIDIEADDAQAEETFSRLFDGSPPIGPTFAGSRGKHRLLRWQDDLPRPDKAVFKIGALEIRTGNGGLGAQSVFPPSIHPDGTSYRWLIGTDEAAIPSLTPLVKNRLANWAGMGADELACGGSRPSNGSLRRSLEDWESLIGGVSEGGRNDAAAAMAGKLLEAMADPFNSQQVAVQWAMLRAWNSQNAPPLEEGELLTTFKSILSRERKKREAEVCGAGAAVIQTPGVASSIKPAPALAASQRIDDERNEESLGVAPESELSESEGDLYRRCLEALEEKGRDVAAWNLLYLDSKPKVWLLLCRKYWHGIVRLSTSEYNSARAIRNAIMEQKSRSLPQGFEGAWKGKLRLRLCDSAICLPAPPELHRDKVVARALCRELAKATTLRDGGQLRRDCGPTALEDGSIVFSFDALARPLQLGEDRISKAELSAACTAAGAKWYRPNQMRGHALKRIAQSGFAKLKGYCEFDGDSLCEEGAANVESRE